MADIPGSDAGDARLAIADVTFARAWNVRGDPRNDAFASEASRALGLALPLAAMTSTCKEPATVLWLGPRSWLYVDDVASAPGAFEQARRAVNAAGGALFDVSANYVSWRVSGTSAARVLNRACPLDFHPRSFAKGACAQSVLGHINALFYKPGEDPSFVVMVARSFASDALHVLRLTAGAPPLTKDTAGRQAR